jgi:hypothetical protein
METSPAIVDKAGQSQHEHGIVPGGVVGEDLRDDVLRDAELPDEKGVAGAVDPLVRSRCVTGPKTEALFPAAG